MADLKSTKQNRIMNKIAQSKAQRRKELLSLPTNELLSRLNTSPNGLSSEEAEKRLEIYGRNEFAKKRKGQQS